VKRLSGPRSNELSDVLEISMTGAYRRVGRAGLAILRRRPVTPYRTAEGFGEPGR
jgi:hypothetical protein